MDFRKWQMSQTAPVYSYVGMAYVVIITAKVYHRSKCHDQQD